MADTTSVPGLAEAERLYGRPVERSYELGACGDLERFWHMWSHRQGEVVLVLQRPDGRILLQSKAFYPAGTFRLPSGSIQAGEPLLEAVQRELREETGLTGRVLRFLGILHYHFTRCAQEQERASYVFLLSIGPEPVRPEDESEQITLAREVRPEELHAIAQSLEHMGGEWAVWGRFRALAHEFVASVMRDA